MYYGSIKINFIEHMKVNQHFKQYVNTIFNGNQAATARAFGVNRSTICNILKGKIGFSPKLARRAEELSGGRFRKEDFIWPENANSELINSSNSAKNGISSQNSNLKHNQKIDVNQDLSNKVNVPNQDNNLGEGNDYNNQSNHIKLNIGSTDRSEFKPDLLGNSKETKLPVTVTASKNGLKLNINLNLQGLIDLNSKGYKS